MSRTTSPEPPQSSSRTAGRTTAVTRPIPARTPRREHRNATPAAPGPDNPQSLTDAALAVWASIVAALEEAGLHDAGPEYLKLSRLLTEQRAQELLGTGKPDAEWEAVQRLAWVALELLAPLVEAADLLTTDPHQAMAALRRTSPRTGTSTARR